MLNSQKGILIILLLLTQLFTQAQNGTISGRIADAESVGLDFVNVLLLNASDASLVKGGITDENGRFTIDRITPGNYHVSASMVGFNDVHSDIIHSNNDQIEIPELQMATGLELEEVTIKAKKPFIELQADKVVVNVENSNVNAGNTALEVLKKSPGVVVDKDNNISLRGKQGVLVTINGKQQHMAPEEIATLLETMPAENISRIEIIANPSAKYDAEGNSGIINIRMKKNENLGINGQFTGSVRQGKKFSYNTGLNLNYRSEKMNIYGSGSRYDWGGFQDIHLNRTIPNDQGATVFDQTTDMNREGISYDAKLGIDYDLSNKTTVGILAKYNGGHRVSDHDNMTHITGTNLPPFSFLNVLSEGRSDRDQYSFNFNVKHSLDDKGTEITFDTDYSRYDNPMMDLYNNFYMDDVGDMVLEPYMLRNNFSTAIDIFASKVDFTKSLENGINMELGAKVSMVETNNDTRFESIQDGEWVNEDFRSNNFAYKEDVLAGYANFSKPIGKVNVQAGLRVEHTMSTGNSITLDDVVEREYTDFFPSVSISHTIGKDHSLSYTYSRRLNRPNYKSLNPFVEYLDQYTFQRGNAFLNPQYADAFGINYGLGRSLFISANYSYTKDAITQVIEQFSEDNTTFQTWQNLEDQHSASLTVSVPKVWSELYTTRLSVTTFYNEFKSAIPSGTLDNRNLAHNLYLSNSFTLPQDWALEVSGNYRSKLIYALFEIDAQYGVDLGVSKSVFNGKGNLKLGVDDIFHTRDNEGRVLQDDINVKFASQWDSRRAKLSFSYNFGNQKVKAARKRSTATEDETKRISEE